MKLSKKSDYALRAMIYLSANYKKGAVQIKEISAKEKIPQKFYRGSRTSICKPFGSSKKIVVSFP